MAAMGAERSKLHELSVGGLKWGDQKFCRDMKADSDAVGSSEILPAAKISSSRRRDVYAKGRDWPRESLGKSPVPSATIGGLKRSRVESDGGDVDGIEAMRVRLMHDLKTAVDKVKVSLTGRGVAEEAPETAMATAAEMPWNLRKRRAAPISGGGGKNSKMEESPRLRTEIKPPPEKPASAASPARRGVATSPEKKERLKFAVPLSRTEIEEDYYAIAGRRPPRRPKKRSRALQKDFDSLCPGQWLTEVTADMYEVPELPA